MKTTKWMASLAMSAVLLGPTLSVNAQYVQNAIGIPIAPGCGPGESWTKNGARYQCETPQPSCAYGFASGPVWTGSSWSFSCNAPPAPPQQPSTPTGGGAPTPTSLLASCESAIESSASGSGAPYSILPFANGGWALDGTYWTQPSAQSVFLGNDTNFALYSNGGLDYAYTVYDSVSAGILIWYQCVINPSSGAVGGVTSGAASGPCSGCGGSN
jgi:hypothetical protein